MNVCTIKRKCSSGVQHENLYSKKIIIAVKKTAALPATALPGMRLGKSLRLWNPVVPCGFGFAENAGNERIAKGGTADGTAEGRAGSA